MLEENSHPATTESCGYPSEKKRSPRIGQQDVSSCLLVSFSKNAALISNCSRPRDYRARGAVSPCASYMVCGWERVFVESC